MTYHFLMYESGLDVGYKADFNPSDISKPDEPPFL